MLHPMPSSTKEKPGELVSSSPSLDLENYAVTVPTLEDSTSAGDSMVNFYEQTC